MIRSIFTLGAAQIISWIGGAALAVLLPRYLGDANLGKLAFALAFTQLLGLLADLGTPIYLTREVAREPGRGSALTAQALAMRLPLSLLAAILAVAVVNLAGYDALTRRIVTALSLAIVLDALNKVTLASLQGFQQMRLLAAVTLLSKLSYAGLTAAVLFAGAGPLEVAIAWIVSQSLTLTVSLLALRGRVELPRRPEWASWRLIFLGGLPFFAWQAALLVYGQVDAVLLSFLTHDAVVGWYAAAYRIVTIPLFLPTIVMTVTLPALSAAATKPAAFNTIARRAVHGVLLLGLPMALGILLLADRLIVLFGYPEAFSHSVLPIALLAMHIPLVGVDMVIGTVLTARDRQRQWALTGVGAALLNPLLNLVAIPYTQHAYGNGAIGAALVTTLTEVFMLVVGLRLLPSGVLDRSVAVDALKCLVAGLAMGLVVCPTHDLPLVVPVLCGALVYAGGCLVLGSLAPNDVKEVWRQLARRHEVPRAGLLSEGA